MYKRQIEYSLKILHISDTHGKHHELGNLPAADVFVHSGDFTSGGSDSEALDFMEWLCDLPYKHKIFIAGNHDDCMMDATLDGLPEGVHYLADSGVCIDGVYFYGVPMFCGLVDGKMQEIERCGNIPNKVDVLITHRPPLGILDGGEENHFGSASILHKVVEIQPRIHLFGHAHNGYGMKTWKNIVFSNASVVDDDYNITNTARVMDETLLQT